MPQDPTSFKAPYITREQAWEAAEAVRKQHWPEADIPVDIERVMQRAGLRIEPIYGLKQDGDVDAVLLSDLKTIIVDAADYMDDRKENRMRFSISHEIGHFALHAGLYRSLEFSSVEEWLSFIDGLPEDQWSFVEYHANEFAGRLLVPVDPLTRRLGEAMQDAEKKGAQGLGRG